MSADAPEDGLFHKKGFWTARHPGIPHGFCRGRSERFAVEGAVLCLVLDRTEVVEGADYEVEGGGEAVNVLRFKHGLPPEVVEYALLHEEIRFAGGERARRPAPWPRAKFRW